MTSRTDGRLSSGAADRDDVALPTGGADVRADGRRGDDATGTPAVAVEGLAKRFGSGETAVTAVDGVSFEIDRGSIVGLLGPNGAGKTTLVKSILGMVLPDAGTVRVDGIDVRARPRAAYSKVDAMLEGARNDYWRLTVRENLRYFATVGGVDPDSVAGRHDRLLEQLELADAADVPVRDLSRGMKQKVSLASVLAGGADVVFLDEPTLGLDVESTRTLEREIRRLAEEEGLTVVLSSHDMDVIETVCDRVLILSGGRIVADGAVDELRRGRGARGLRVASPDLDDDVLGRLRDRFEVTETTAPEGVPTVEIDADGDGLYEAIEILRRDEVRVERLSTIEPDLEDVFVELTGGRTR